MVAIGDRCWFAENLRTTQYATGTSIISSAYAYPDNNASFLDDFGRLYRGACVINNSQSICPSFWHIPTSADYDSLLANYPNANAVKASPDDDWQWNGTNESGLTLVPAGYANVSPTYSACSVAADNWYELGFNGLGIYFYNAPSGNRYFRVNNTEDYYSNSMNNGSFYSIRCVKD